MIYLSAQPDQLYLIWQLEIQLRNLNKLGIQRDEIQVLVAYNKDLGLSSDFQNFIDAHTHLATFFAYEDRREKPKYTSSVRPNVLKQHFAKYPTLVSKTLMYHDSDILFSRIPQIDNVEQDDICYVSDTRNYLDAGYIRNTSSEELLNEMLHIVGLDKEKLLKENHHTGGAQYILKGVTANFWEKVENDSERLYVAMKNYNTKIWEKSYATTKEYRSKKRGIQAWCADMWAVLWNLWLHDKKVEIHPEMSFSWPYNPIEDWNRLAIQHYSGNIEDQTKYFKKSEYLNYPPWYDSRLDLIHDTNCSYEIVQLIKSRTKELYDMRDSFPKTCIVLDTLNKPLQKEQYRLIRTYIQKSLNINIYVADDNSIAKEQLLTKLQLDFSNVLRLPITAIPDVREIKKILLNKGIKCNYIYQPQNIYKVDSLFFETFSKVLDMELLHLNKGKFNTQSSLTDNSIHYINLGENQQERRKRIQQLFHNNDNSLNQERYITTTYNFIN